MQPKSCHPLARLITYTHIQTHTSGPLWQMSLFKLTEVRPDSLPLLHHPEKALSSAHHPPAPSSMLIMGNFCLVSSFSQNRTPLLLPRLTLPPSLSIHPYSCQTSSRPSSTLLNLPFHSHKFTHSFTPPAWSCSIRPPQYRHINITCWDTMSGLQAVGLRKTVSHGHGQNKRCQLMLKHAMPWKSMQDGVLGKVN